MTVFEDYRVERSMPLNYDGPRDTPAPWLVFFFVLMIVMAVAAALGTIGWLISAARDFTV